MYELYKPICEVGSGRSGTYFLAKIISQHEDVAYMDAPKYIWRHGNALWPDDCLAVKHARPRVVRYVRRRFAQFVQEQGKKRFFENAQSNVLALPFVNAVLPESKIIHIIRDGRDVAASLRNIRTKRRTKKIVKGTRSRLPGIPMADWPAYFPEFVKNVWKQRFKKEAYAFGPKIKNWKELYDRYDLLEFCAITWHECVTAAINFGRALPPGRYHEVRFDDLITNPVEVIAKLFDFLELPPSDLVTRFIHEKIDYSAKGRWQRRLSQEELNKIMKHAGDLLKELNML